MLVRRQSLTKLLITRGVGSFIRQRKVCTEQTVEKIAIGINWKEAGRRRRLVDLRNLSKLDKPVANRSITK